MADDGSTSNRRDPIKSSVGNVAGQRRRQQAVTVAKERRELLVRAKRLCRVGINGDVEDTHVESEMMIDAELPILEAQASKSVEELKSAARYDDIGRIIAKGYDIRLPHDDVVSALRKHFASCGEITDVYISLDYKNDLWNCAYVYFLGEGAVDKALQLDGTDVGGWNVSVKAYPFQKHANDWADLRVEGYDPSLSENKIKSALIKLFSSYGEIREIIISEGDALVSLFGEDAAVKAPELSGSYLRGRKVIVQLISGLGKTTFHKRRRVRSLGGRRVAEMMANTTAK